METNSPASTNGVKLPLDRADARQVTVIQIPVHLEDIARCLEYPEEGIPTNVDLVNVEWEVGPEVLTHGSATAAYACYQSHSRMRRETFLTFPQWLDMIMPVARNQVQLGQNLTSPQTTA
jgi:hypothetical protein